MAAHEPETQDGQTIPPGQDEGGNAEREEALRRADALLADLGTRLGHWTARARRQAARLTARTREELEDIWAEAQDLRRREGDEAAGSGDQAG